LGQVQFQIQPHVQVRGVPSPALVVNVVVLPQNVNDHVQFQGALEPAPVGAGELAVSLPVGPVEAVAGGDRPLVVPCVGTGAGSSPVPPQPHSHFHSHDHSREPGSPESNDEEFAFPAQSTVKSQRQFQGSLAIFGSY
jgi:hypothetical protein